MDFCCCCCCLIDTWLNSGASQVVLAFKNQPANAGDVRDMGLIPELERSPGEGKGYSLQYSALENSMDCRVLLLLSHFSRVRPCVTPKTAAHQAPLSLGFSSREYWSGLPFPSPMHACMLSHFSCVRLCATP